MEGRGVQGSVVLRSVVPQDCGEPAGAGTLGPAVLCSMPSHVLPARGRPTRKRLGSAFFRHRGPQGPWGGGKCPLAFLQQGGWTGSMTWSLPMSGRVGVRFGSAPGLESRPHAQTVRRPVWEGLGLF